MTSPSIPESTGVAFRLPLEERTIVILYIATVFACRIALRMCAATMFHWAVAMFLEDGLSFISFGLAFAYLVRSNGAPLTSLVTCISWSVADTRQGANYAGDGSALALTGIPAIDPRVVGLYYVGL
eukprot:TRINITY_DN43917_c0_g1_i1.p1 TRINITY_DN43917_c0_g1~~TRINITY_DN43917_c0_g1_i1.p1  ORF type:complete len:126 (-),score=4.36 TRINITY_DN43917_c0_g1_i1:366-743(-)